MVTSTSPATALVSRLRRSFKGKSVELDALPSAVLCDLVRDCFGQHISQHDLSILREAEESKRDFLRMLATTHGD